MAYYRTEADCRLRFSADARKKIPGQLPGTC